MRFYNFTILEIVLSVSEKTILKQQLYYYENKPAFLKFYPNYKTFRKLSIQKGLKY